MGIYLTKLLSVVDMEFIFAQFRRIMSHQYDCLIRESECSACGECKDVGVVIHG